MLTTIIEKTGYSLAGIRDTWLSEPSFRQWFWLVALSNIAALLFSPAIIWSVLIIVTGFLLLASELINTAIEAITNKASPEQHPLAKKAKDAGSAMTLVTFLALASSWIGILIEFFCR
jgi:diacylglycerol kinase (ATP)